MGQLHQAESEFEQNGRVDEEHEQYESLMEQLVAWSKSSIVSWMTASSCRQQQAHFVKYLSMQAKIL